MTSFGTIMIPCTSFANHLKWVVRKRPIISSSEASRVQTFPARLAVPASDLHDMPYFDSLRLQRHRWESNGMTTCALRQEKAVDAFYSIIFNHLSYSTGGGTSHLVPA